MAREINLVPDIKNEMIKALKMRNLIFFVSIVVAIASVTVTLVTALIMVGQQAALDGKQKTIDHLSDKVKSYDDLNDFLTIRDQINDINDLTSNKKVLSRAFNILGAIIPSGADTITISELNVDLSAKNPTFNFEAQANAGQDPYIDYNVLDAFKKSMNFMRYDYGRYVDKNGDEIPGYCMIESSTDGGTLVDAERGQYAFWTIKEEGCAPKSVSSDDSDDKTTTSITNVAKDYQTESYEGKEVVRIWRTPQFGTWYKKTQTSDQPTMTLEGAISNVEHFESSCITYTGHNDSNYVASNDEQIVSKVDGITWVSKNITCLLVPDGENGITTPESSNGRDENNELVLRFTSTINFAPEFFDFKKLHMMAIAPSGRRNVTDSYVQLQAMFSERASDCAQGDTSCTDNKTNSGGDANTNNTNNNNNSNNSGTINPGTANSDNTNNTNNTNNERNQNG